MSLHCGWSEKTKTSLRTLELKLLLLSLNRGAAMKATKLFLFPIFAAIVVGCGSQVQSEQAASTGASFAQEAGDTSAFKDEAASSRGANLGGESSANVARLVSNENPAMRRDVVKTGSLTVQVEKVDDAERKARHIAESAGGRVDQVGSSDLAGPSPTIDMTLRIPVGKFESVMENLEKLGARMAKQVSVDDVTEKLVDFNARMKTMLAQEEVVRNMLRKANKLSDSLTINNDLTRLRGEIESIAAQRKSLSSQAAYSTLEVKLTQTSSVVAVAATDPNWFQTSWASAWGAGTSVFRSGVSLLMWFLVFSPVWITFFLLLRWMIKALGKASPASAPSEAQRPV
jgi:hypothetical protein